MSNDREIALTNEGGREVVEEKISVSELIERLSALEKENASQRQRIEELERLSGVLNVDIVAARAIAKAHAGHSFVVTTGTGSGKSMCFFVPIVDAVLRARKARAPASTRAIIVYPMNALANSQIEEIEGFLEQAGLSEEMRPRVQRYTGQEKEDERKRVAANPPDVLLTNYRMLE